VISENTHLPPGAAAPAPRQSALAAWARLLRLPNLLTVPGDALAGFLLMYYPGWGSVDLSPAVPCAAASLLMYCAGLLWNDYFDRHRDRLERPERPIPSGAIRPMAALAAGVAAMVGGLAAAMLAGPAALAVAALLALAVLGYNLGLKRLRGLGPLTMGLCRGLSLLLGAAAIGAEPLADAVSAMARSGTAIVVSFFGMIAYVAAVTYLATKENNQQRVGNSRELPGLAIIAWFVLLYNFAGLPNRLAPSIIAAIAAANWALYCVGSVRAPTTPQAIQRAVGDLVRDLLLIQAALAAVVFWPGVIVALVLAGAWVVFGPLARRFPPS